MAKSKLERKIELQNAFRRRSDKELIDEVVAWTKAGSDESECEKRHNCIVALAEYFDATSLVLIVRGIQQSKLLD